MFVLFVLFVFRRQLNIKQFEGINIVTEKSIKLCVETHNIYGLEKPNFESQTGQEAFLFFKISRLALRRNQLSAIVYWETLKMWVNRPAPQADQSHQCSIDVKNEWIYNSVCWSWTGLVWLRIGPVVRLHDLYCSPNIVLVIISKIMRWAGRIHKRRIQGFGGET